MSEFAEIFSKGSQTFYNSTFFFPKAKQQQITRLYAFVRRADDYVDATPQNLNGFYAFKALYLKLSQDKETEPNTSKNTLEITSQDHLIITSFVALEKEFGFDPAWTMAFLDSMERDLTQNTYQNLSETVSYIYGSANVIGLFMAKIMGLPQNSYQSAEYLGQAFQYINFIRDIAEDITLGRNYFPQDLMQKHNLESLEFAETNLKKAEFEAFVAAVIAQYIEWQNAAKTGFEFIPKSYRVAIQTASDMYYWTAMTIARDPFMVYQKKIKPSKFRILSTGFKNLIRVYYGRG